MKRILLFVLLLPWAAAFSSSVHDTTKTALAHRSLPADIQKQLEIYKQAFKLCQGLAQQGNVRAMYRLATLYYTGEGGELNKQEAFNWYKKAGEAGYNVAWYDLGMMYQKGDLAPQDFTKAFDCYAKGATLHNGHCMCAQGYIYYKGLGREQSYQKAVPFFKAGAQVHDVSSNYMLGICFRNGYGIAADQDSSKYYLSLAVKKNDIKSIKEAATVDPENMDIKDITDLQPRSTKYVPKDFKSGYKIVNEHVDADYLAGSFKGLVVKYDWSGQHIIDQKALDVKLELNNKQISGKWTEEGQQAIALHGVLTDSGLVFSDTKGSYREHYHLKTPDIIVFKKATLEMAKKRDTVFIAANLSRYSTIFMEPEKPVFVMLRRAGANYNSVAYKADRLKNESDSLHFIAYPNPFSSNLQLRFTLKKKLRVSIMVSNMQTAAIVYNSQQEELEPGDYTRVVNYNGLPGQYVVTLKYGNRIKSAIVIKN